MGDGQGYQERWAALPVVLTGVALTIIDSMVVNIASATIQSDLRASGAMLELIIGGYLLSFAALLVPCGRIGDVVGHRRMFLLGLIAFVATSGMCGLASNAPMLVGARVIQGAAAAALAPQVLALIAVMFPARERSVAMSCYGVVIGLGSVAGQILGGFLVTVDVAGLGWRPIFLINLPVGLLVLPFAWRFLPRTAAAGRRPGEIDMVGSVGLALGIGLAVIHLVLGRSQGWPWWGWACLAAAVPVVVGTLAYERRLARSGRAPVFDVALLGNRRFSAGLVVNLLFALFFPGLMLGLTLYLQQERGQTAVEVTALFVPAGLAFALTSLAVRRLVRTVGPPVVTLGFTISLIGVIWILADVVGSEGVVTAGRLAAPMVLVAGIGSGMALPATITFVLASVRATQAGVASGVFNTLQQFANALGIALMGVMYFRHDRLGGHEALRSVLIVDLVLIVLAIGCTFGLYGASDRVASRRRTPHCRADRPPRLARWDGSGVNQGRSGSAE